MKLFFSGILILFLFGACEKKSLQEAENKSSDYLFNGGPVVVRGKIENPKSDEVLFGNVEITGEVEYTTTLDSLGNFEFVFDILSAHDSYLYHKGQYVTIFAQPNDTIFITGDGSNLEQTVTFSGSNARFNESLKRYYNEFFELEDATNFFEKKDVLPPDEFKDFAVEFFDRLEKKAEEIIAATEANEQALRWMKTHIKYQKAEDLLEYGTHHKEDLPEDYYDFTTDYEKITLADLECSQYYDDFLMKYHFGYELGKKEGFEEMVKQLREQSYDGLLHVYEFVNKHTENKQVKNLLLTNFTTRFIEFDHQTIDSIFTKYAGYVDDITCQNFIQRRLDAAKSETPLVQNLSELRNDAVIGDLIQEIQEQTKGKVLFIDIWGTWCGGCIATFPASDKLYKSLNHDQVEFVYLCVNSKKSNWEKMVKRFDLKGKNYLLSKEQSNELSKKFKYNSVPRYIIVDKQGGIVDANAKQPYSKALKVELEELMMK